MVPGRTRTTSWTASPWASPRAPRTTSVIFSASPAVSGDVSATRTARSPAAPASTANAAAQPGRRGRTGRVGGEFAALRVVVAAGDGDQVLRAAGDEEFAGGRGAGVAGARETAVPAVGPGAEGLAGGQGVAPVAPGDARAADADLA